MIEDYKAEAKERNSAQPISQESFDHWRDSRVTRRLLEDLELSVLDSFQDYLMASTTDEIALAAMLRQGAALMVERVIDWSPEGVEGVNDDD